MGIHTGSAADAPVGLVGFDVHHAARVASVGHGGQVLLSSETADRVHDALPEGSSLRCLGLHRLKDLPRSETLFQLSAKGLRAHFPPLRTLENLEPPNNLPSPASEFIGRSSELATVRSLLRESPFVTIAGGGGTGKTRLSIEVARELLDGTTDAVWFVDLSTIVDQHLVAMTVMGVLGLQQSPSIPVVDALLESLRDQDILLVLDNCEHVLDAVAELVDRITRSCPKVRVLATSREPIGVDAEHLYRIPAMALPADDAEGARELASADAVELFVARAVAQEAPFMLDEVTALLVVSICRHLDGNPLAIELAAARLPSMSIVDLEGRMDERFQLLNVGRRTSPARHRSLEAMVAWSYDLLSHEDQDVLCRLSVFVADFDLEAAEAVCAEEDRGASHVALAMDSLVKKSLVTAERLSERLRYRLLETIRDFAGAQRRTSGMLEEWRDVELRCAEHYLSLSERASSELVGRDQGSWLSRLDLERPNLMATFEFFANRAAQPREVLRLGVATGRYFHSRQDRATLGYLQAALTTQGSGSPSLRAKALLAVADLLGGSSPDEHSLSGAFDASEEALELSRATGDPALEVFALATMSRVAGRRGHPDEAASYAASALDVARDVGEPRCLGRAYKAVADVQPTVEARRPFCMKSLEHFREAGDSWGICSALLVLAVCDFDDLDQVRNAAKLEEEAILIAEEIGSTSHLLILWSNRAIASFLLEEVEQAETFARRVLITERRLGSSWLTLPSVFVLSCCATRRGEFDTAARLSGACDRLDDEFTRVNDWEWAPLEIEMRDRNRLELEVALGEAYALRCGEGRRLGTSELVDLALGGSTRDHARGTTP